MVGAVVTMSAEDEWGHVGATNRVACTVSSDILELAVAVMIKPMMFAGLSDSKSPRNGPQVMAAVTNEAKAVQVAATFQTLEEAAGKLHGAREEAAATMDAVAQVLPSGVKGSATDKPLPQLASARGSLSLSKFSGCVRGMDAGCTACFVSVVLQREGITAHRLRREPVGVDTKRCLPMSSTQWSALSLLTGSCGIHRACQRLGGGKRDRQRRWRRRRRQRRGGGLRGWDCQICGGGGSQHQRHGPRWGFGTLCSQCLPCLRNLILHYVMLYEHDFTVVHFFMGTWAYSCPRNRYKRRFMAHLRVDESVAAHHLDACVNTSTCACRKY